MPAVDSSEQTYHLIARGGTMLPRQSGVERSNAGAILTDLF
jgi:hypothetical protein